jgi:restriction system protein
MIAIKTPPSVDEPGPELLHWLNEGKNPRKARQQSRFPSDDMLADYLRVINTFSDADIFALLRRFLVHTGSLGVDGDRIEQLGRLKSSEPELYASLRETDSVQRLFRIPGADHNPWQGITWVIDLLPHHPREAINVLDAYFMAHAFALPDGRINSLDDAQAIIRARWIQNPIDIKGKMPFLNSLEEREFEHLVDELYAQMDYDAILTSQWRDDGRDVIATSTVVGRREIVLVECKHYAKPVRVQPVRHLLGVVTDAKATKGVLATNASLTRGARDFADRNPSLELITGEQLILLLNEHCGHDWAPRLDRLLTASKRRDLDRATASPRMTGTG